jgi:hypothetical protein
MPHKFLNVAAHISRCMRKSDLIPGWIEKELRANFARASCAGRRAAKTEPRAAFAAYRSQELRRAKTGARAAVLAPDRGRIPWNLDVWPFLVLLYDYLDH